MADQRITQLTALPKAGVAANDVLPIADISASETKKVTVKDLVGAGVDLVDNGEIDLAKLDQASVTKLGTTALADDAVTYDKLQNVSTTDRLLGRSSAGAGNVEEIPLTAAGRALIDDADAAAQRTTLGLGTIATQNANSVAISGGAITGGTISGITDLAIADGGTGASTAAVARQNLGLEIGVNVQAYDAGLQSIAGLTTSANQLPYTTGTDTYAVTPLTAAGRALLDDATAADQRTTLGLGTLATQSAANVNITGGVASVNSITATSATITGGTISGITDLAIADGGTGASTASDARANLGVAIGTDVQAYDAGLQSIAGLTTAANELLYTTGPDTYTTTSITAAGRALIDDADATAQRATLGLGSLSTLSSINTAELDDDAVTAAKLANESTVDLVTTLPVAGAFTGQFALVTSTNKLYCWNGATWAEAKAAGSVNGITADNTSVIDLTITSSGDQVTIAAAPENTANAAEFLAGPTGNAGTVGYRQIVGSDLPAATATTKGAVIVDGEGLRMNSDNIEIDNDVVASSTHHVVIYDDKGLITGGRGIEAGDLPAATTSAKGGVIVGTGLSVDGTGLVNHANNVISGTATKITFDSEGHVTGTLNLDAADIPSLDTAKITTGTFPSDRLAADSVTAAKLADYSTAQISNSAPAADYIGQLFFNPLDRTLFMWDGNVYQPIGVSFGQIIFAGTYDASTNLVTSVTTDGTAIGLVVGAGLVSPTESTRAHYVVVDVAGTGTAPAPAVALAPPDIILSTGSDWVLLDVSDTVTAQLASNVQVTPAGNIASTNVQAALQELDAEKIQKAGDTMTGALVIGDTGSLAFEGTTDNAFETTLGVVDPTADRTVLLPDADGTVALASQLNDGTY